MAAQATALFREFDSSTAGVCFRIVKGKACVVAYQEAAKTAIRLGDMPNLLSLNRNLGVVHARLAAVMQGLSRALSAADFASVMYHYSEALQAFTQCLSIRSSSTDGGGKPVHWAAGVERKMVETVAQLVACVRDQRESCQERASVLERLQLPDREWGCLARALVQQAVADDFYKAALRLDNDNDRGDAWRMQLSLLEDVRRPAAEAAQALRRLYRLRGDESVASLLSSELAELEASCVYLGARVQSKRFRLQGLAQLRHMLFDLEALNADLMWETVDVLRAAATALIDSDASDRSNPVFRCHESLAKAYSSLGLVFEKVVKMDDVANALYLACLQHATIVTGQSGATFHSHDWYQQAKGAIEARRQRKLAYEAGEMEKLRAPTLVKLKPQLDALQKSMAACESKAYKVHALLVYLRTTHPPKSRDAPKEPLAYDRDDNKVTSRQLKKAIVEYHPDKQHNKDAGVDWTVLCEEITKQLNAFYEHFKGMG